MLRRRLWLPVVLACSVSVGVWAAGAKIMSVQMKQSELRSSPSGLGSVVATVKQGDALTVIEEKGVWTKASLGDKVGWIPTSSLVKGTLKLKAGDKDAQVAASSDEMSLATKGFTSQVEADFKNQHKDVDFTWVDKMGQIKISAEAMREFLKQGAVEAGKGATK